MTKASFDQWASRVVGPFVVCLTQPMGRHYLIHAICPTRLAPVQNLSEDQGEVIRGGCLVWKSLSLDNHFRYEAQVELAETRVNKPASFCDT